jgi:hypothetical protein
LFDRQCLGHALTSFIVNASMAPRAVRSTSQCTHRPLLLVPSISVMRPLLRSVTSKRQLGRGPLAASGRALATSFRLARRFLGSVRRCYSLFPRVLQLGRGHRTLGLRGRRHLGLRASAS